MSFNKITIVGYLGRDPELRYTPQGTAVCNFSVATTEKRKNGHGETEERTTWFRVTTWSRQAELANDYLAKGRQVFIEGRLSLNVYTDRDGVERTTLEVNATDMQFRGRRGEPAQPTSANAGRGQAEEEEEVTVPAPNGSGKKGSSKRATKKTANVDNEETVSVEDGDMPF